MLFALFTTNYCPMCVFLWVGLSQNFLGVLEVDLPPFHCNFLPFCSSVLVLTLVDNFSTEPDGRGKESASGSFFHSVAAEG